MDQKFSKEYDKILSAYAQGAKVESKRKESYLEEFSYKLRLHAGKFKEYDTRIKICKFLARIIPLVGTAIAGALKAILDRKFPPAESSISLYIFVFVLAVTLIVSLILFFIESLFLPSTSNELESLNKIFELERSQRRLAAQLTLYSSIYKSNAEDDTDRIQILSSRLEKLIFTEIGKKWDEKFKFLITTRRRTYDVLDTHVEIPNIPNEIIEELEPLARQLCSACEVIFGPAEYCTKIYLRTLHELNFENKNFNIEMMTALVKYPKIHNNNPLKVGKSWLKGISGENNAVVWKCFYDKPIICCVDEPKPGKSEVYPSIVYLRLPEGLGVITIYSSDKSTFASESVFADNERNTFINTANMLVRQAIINSSNILGQEKLNETA